MPHLRRAPQRRHLQAQTQRLPHAHPLRVLPTPRHGALSLQRQMPPHLRRGVQRRARAKAPSHDFRTGSRRHAHRKVRPQQHVYHERQRHLATIDVLLQGQQSSVLMQVPAAVCRIE